jgi:hypothetical protein
MSDAPDDGDLSGKVVRLTIECHPHGYLISARLGPAGYLDAGGGEMLPFTGADFLGPADRDELADLVRRLMAEPPESRDVRA